jgi:hypothetical protein
VVTRLECEVESAPDHDDESEDQDHRPARADICVLAENARALRIFGAGDHLNLHDDAMIRLFWPQDLRQFGQETVHARLRALAGQHKREMLVSMKRPIEPGKEKPASGSGYVRAGFGILDLRRRSKRYLEDSAASKTP